MHFQSYCRLQELHTIIIIVIEVDEQKPTREQCVIARDTKGKAKAREMVNVIKNQDFWNALAVYVTP